MIIYNCYCSILIQLIRLLVTHLFFNLSFIEFEFNNSKLNSTMLRKKTKCVCERVFYDRPLLWRVKGDNWMWLWYCQRHLLVLFLEMLGLMWEIQIVKSRPLHCKWLLLKSMPPFPFNSHPSVLRYTPERAVPNSLFWKLQHKYLHCAQHVKKNIAISIKNP